MSETARAALFADTFYETNGAANVIRRLTDYAAEKNYPFLCVYAGDETRVRDRGSVRFLELKRGALAVKLDTELKYDPLLWRHKNLVKKTLEEFQPDVLHLTGFSDVSQLGFYLAHYEKISAVASWHTNGHEYAARRTLNKLCWLPAAAQRKLGKFIEKTVLHGSMKMYFLAQLQLAPNEELVCQLRRMTGRPSFLMSRGVDTDFLTPDKRRRADAAFNIGYVGRLQAEKNVRFIADLDAFLQKRGAAGYKFTVVGDGAELEWLRKKLPHAEFTGVLRGEPLAQAFASMDLFVFPSKTDAFGNVVLEAMASGVPAVVMPDGGPKFLIENGANGFIARDETDFCEIVKNAVAAPDQLTEIKERARKSALLHSWESIFENIFEKYRYAVTLKKNVRVGENNQLLTAE